MSDLFKKDFGFKETEKLLKELEKERSLNRKKKRKYIELQQKTKNKILKNSVYFPYFNCQKFRTNKKFSFKGSKYISKEIKFIPEKNFKFIDICCKKRCVINEEIQKSEFEKFWSISDFNKQNDFLF